MMKVNRTFQDRFEQNVRLSIVDLTSGPRIKFEDDTGSGQWDLTPMETEKLYDALREYYGDEYAGWPAEEV